MSGQGRGRFITLEGGEGAGKSTQASRLAGVLRASGAEVVLTREPGGSPGAEEIRALLVDGDVARWDAVTETLLHFTARRDHLLNTIAPALDRGAWVISDRFVDSTVAYQGYGHGVPLKLIDELARICIADRRPDLTLILDLPVAVGLARANRRGTAEDRYERMNDEFHARVRDGFREIARREPSRCVVVDASGDVEAVHRAVVEAVTRRLGMAALP